MINCATILICLCGFELGYWCCNRAWLTKLQNLIKDIPPTKTEIFTTIFKLIE